MNLSEHTELFLEEARELLIKIENALLELEKRPEDRELVNEVFRGLHTIKGSGAMFGFGPVAEFTHQVENLFDEVRKGRIAVNPRIIDIGLRAADGISRLLLDPDSDPDHKTLLSDIELLRSPIGTETNGVIQESDPPGPGTLSRQKGAGDPQAWRILLKPQAQILNRGVRLESLFSELGELGVYHAQAMTDALPGLEDLDFSSVYLSWAITLATSESLANIRAVFMFVEDYMEITIDPIESVNEFGEPVTPKLGEILVSRGNLSSEQVDAVRQAQTAFGEVAVAQGLLKPVHVEAALAEQTIIRGTNNEREGRQESATIRVRKEKLDALVDLVGELVILQAILDLKAKGDSTGTFAAISETLARLAADLRDTTMNIRMVPLEESFASFQRLTRDLSRQVGKELRLDVSGGSTELDKNIIEALKDPLIHILRNTADHGIEPTDVRLKAGKDAVGKILISARQVGSRVEIAVSDDGGGLNLARIKARAVEHKLIDASETNEKRIMAMIFEPGFSTAAKTTGLSGRGVGMDVVKKNIEKLRGEVSLKSETGKGMTVTLSIPLTLVIVEGLLVQVAGSDYVISLSQVEECVDLTDDLQVGRKDGSMIRLRGKTIPVLSLREILGIPKPFPGLSRLVIVQDDGAAVGLLVDSVVGRKQVVIKPLSNSLRPIKILSGATILGDGSVALILDVAEIIKSKTAERADT